jgi:hypothetical protein
MQRRRRHHKRKNVRFAGAHDPSCGDGVRATRGPQNSARRRAQPSQPRGVWPQCAQAARTALASSVLLSGSSRTVTSAAGSAGSKTLRQEELAEPAGSRQAGVRDAAASARTDSNMSADPIEGPSSRASRAPIAMFVVSRMKRAPLCRREEVARGSIGDSDGWGKGKAARCRARGAARDGGEGVGFLAAGRQAGRRGLWAAAEGASRRAKYA